MNIAICSCNTQKRRQILLALLFLTSDIQVAIHEFTDITSFISCLLHDSITYEIAFLDEEMKYVQGVNFREYIRQKRINTELIFVKDMSVMTSAYANMVHDIILRSYMDKEPVAPVYSSNHVNRPNTFTAKWDTKIYRLEYHQILFVETYMHRLRIHTATRFYDCRGSLQSVYDELYSAGFVKTHQSYLVNMKHIRILEPRDVVLSN